MNLPVDLKEAVLGACTSGSLLTWLATDSGEWQAAAITMVVDLARDGVIDAVEALLRPLSSWTWTPDWQARQQVLSKIIPMLDLSVIQMVTALDGLRMPGLQHVLDEAFLTWCKAVPTRPDELVGLLDQERHLSDRFVLAALIAGLQLHSSRYLNVVAAMATDAEHGHQQVGVRALSLLHSVDELSVSAAVRALAVVVADIGGNSEMRALALTSLFDLAACVPSAPMHQFEEVLCAVSLDGVPQFSSACARALCSHALRLPDALFERACDGLYGMGANEPGWDEVDMGLYQLLTSAGGDGRALKLLEMLARRPDGNAVLERLDSAEHELCNAAGTRLDGMVTSWLLTADIGLCGAARWLVEGVDDQERRFKVDPHMFPLNDRRASFLARKAIGWLFIRPVAAVSLITSLLSQVSVQGATELTALLYDPMLMNYPGSTRRLLEEVAPRLLPPAQRAVQEVLGKHDRFMKAIKGVGHLSELYPDEASRRIEAQRQEDEFRTARDKAEGRSIIRSLVHTSLLLHGSRSISYVTGFGQEPRRLDNPLTSMSVEMEHPMQVTFDPLGLELVLLGFRHECSPA